MVLKTASKTKRPTSAKPRLRSPGGIYETIKFGLQEFGYYDQIRQYDPGYYIDKYTYKPRKRVAGYLGQKIYGFPKKIQYRTSSRQFYEELRYNKRRYDWNYYRGYYR